MTLLRHLHDNYVILNVNMTKEFFIPAKARGLPQESSGLQHCANAILGISL